MFRLRNRQARISLPQEKIDHEKKSIASLLRSMLPAGGCDLSALQQQDGGIVTDPLEMANEINSFWQQTFNKKETDAELRTEWLSKIRDRLKCSKENLKLGAIH